MKLSGKQVLGLAVEPGAIAAVQVQRAGTRSQVVRAATFTLPESATIENPDSFGPAFSQFLRDNQFSAKRAVIGLPAAWLAVKERMVPAGDDATTLDMLRLLAESEFATDARELMFDCLLDAAPLHSVSPEEPLRAVLLFATLRRRVDGLVRVAEQAGLRVAAITSSTVALAQAGDAVACPTMLRITPAAVELLWREEDRIGAVRHLATHGPGKTGGTAEWGNSLGAELRRIWLSLPQPTGPRKLRIFDSAGLSKEAKDALVARLSLQPEVAATVGPLTLGGSGEGSLAPEHAAAGALALLGHAEAPPAIDFLHSRLAPPPRRMPALWRYGIAAAAVLLLAFAGLMGDIFLTSRELARMEAEYAELEPQAKKAAQLRDRVRIARGWFDQRPKLLDCLAALTMAFPEQGSVWATTVAIDNDLTCNVTGKAENDSSVVLVREAISRSPWFSEVKSGGIRGADRQSRQVSFSMTFRYQQQGAEQQQSQQSETEQARRQE